MVATDERTALFLKWLIDTFEQCPQKIAVIDHGGMRKTTYEGLYQMACRVVGYLNGLHLPDHSFIGICLPTSMEYIASEIGIWMAGHAIVPMGDQFPQSRIKQIMQHCESPLLIDEAVMSEIVATAPVEPVALPSEDDINALFYTSGSTGKPKGVLHSFRSFGIPLFPDEMFKELDVSLIAVTAPMFFVACKLIYDFLTRGGTANIVPQNVRMDIRKLEDFLAEHEIEFVFIPPSVLPNFHNKSKTLKVVFTASERVSGVGPEGYKLINYCGQTETAGIGATFMVDKPYDNTPIGIPVTPYIYSVRDEDGNEVPFGEEGELCYQGDLTPGYYKDPERTAELYRGGWLHTGDIVRARPDGNLVYVNRKDWMVKINGQRVEPSEVETVLKKMPGIDNAIVKGFTAGNSRQYLCGYYISADGVKDGDILEYLSSKLPSYMIPVYFVKMDSFPVNLNGKLDRKSLRSPASDGDIIDREPYVAPQDEVEEALCNVFSKVLGYDHIGVNEDFFSLGGDSIRVMKMQTLCPELALSARMIYVHRTPRKIAKAYKEKKHVHMELQNDYPLSKTQMGIYAESMLRQGETFYNNSVLYRLGNHVDLSRLAHAFEHFVVAHPYVMVRLFIDEEGNPRQHRADEFPYVQTIEQASDEAFETMKSELVQPFDILHEPLFRIRIFKTPTAAYLFMDFHHIIFDGFSYNILIEDINALYEGKSVEKETWSSYEIAQEEETARETEAYQEARSWNKDVFGCLEIESLPLADNEEVSDVKYESQQRLLSIDYPHLQVACDKLDVTPNVLMTSAFGYLLDEYAYAQESLFAAIYNGRKDLKTNRTIGMLVKTLAVHAKWDQDTTVYEYFQNMKHQLLGSMNNDLFSFSELTAINKHVNSHVLFAYQGDLDFPEVLCGEQFEQIFSKTNATGENLVMEVLRKGNQLLLNIEYQANLYTQAFICRLLECYDTLVRGFANEKGKERRVKRIMLLSEEEQHRLISLGTGEKLDYDTSKTFVSLFSLQAQKTPDAIAVVDSVSSISYAELDRQSNLLAEVLCSAGVGPNHFVALMLPRTKEFITALLAVFKSGAAYIPLDCDYPDSRIQYIMEDAHAQILITTRQLISENHHSGIFASKKSLFLDDVDFSVSAKAINKCQPSSLAYMVYTSGSTGTPKGVVVGQEALLNFITWLAKTEELKPGEQCALHTSFCFDGSMFDLFPPLVSGATLHILSAALRQDMQGLYQYLKNHHIVGMLLTTQLGMAMMEQYELPMRFLMVGGEKLNNFKPSSLKLYNCYGPTEFTVCSTFHLIHQDRVYQNIPIGKTVPNCTSFVVGMTGKMVPQGAVGELCLTGRQMAKGYWNRRVLTDEKFTNCPFVSSEKMYHTGDLVRWNADGELEYVGRIDNLVKIRGYRIELGEIEFKMKDFPGVISSVVMLHTDGQREYLVGFYCAKTVIDGKAIQQYLMAQLPDYMIPQLMIQLEEIPVTLNGKTDYKALQEKVSISSNIPSSRIAPANKDEQTLFDVAKDVLGTHQFGVTDDLTTLGLTSLLAIKLSFLAEKSGKTIKVNDILKYKTIRNIISHRMSIGEWENGYEPGKPVVVLIQGVTSYQKLQSLIGELCKHYSVFIIEPINEHYNLLFHDSEEKMKEVVELYTEYLYAQLPQSAVVSMFVGHSFGGELAYRCASTWFQKMGYASGVCMLDSYMNLYEILDSIPQDTPHLQLVRSLEDGLDWPSYPGKVVLFKATHSSLRQQSVFPQIKVFPVEAGHFTMLENQFVDYYVEKIEKEGVIFTKS